MQNTIWVLLGEGKERQTPADLGWLWEHNDTANSKADSNWGQRYMEEQKSEDWRRELI